MQKTLANIYVFDKRYAPIFYLFVDNLISIFAYEMVKKMSVIGMVGV